MARKRKATFVPMVTQVVETPEGDARVIDLSRPNGITGATVRFLDRQRQKLPDMGMKWFACRDLKPAGTTPTTPPDSSSGRKPLTYDVVNTVNTKLSLQYDFGVHKHGCEDVRQARMAGCDIYQHTETTPAEVIKAEREDLEGGGFSKEEAAAFDFKVFPCAKQTSPPKNRRNAGASSKRKNSLQKRRRSASLRSAVGQSQSPTKRRTTVATATKSRKRGKTVSKKADTKKASSNGGSERRTHEDILELVPEIVEKLRDGVTMTDIRAEYGAGPVIRKALTEKGYNTKGEKIQTEDLTDLTGKKLVQAVAAMREEGAAWYRIELATDMSQADLKELLEENGYEELASGRVAVASEDEEEEEPAPKRTRKGKASASSSKSTKASSTKRRGRRRANPSEEE